MSLPSFAPKVGAAAALAATVLAIVMAGGGSTGCGDEACAGDAAVWAEVTQGPIACKTNADCCVVINGCVSESHIVAAADKARAKAAMDTCGPCDRCLAPAIQVGCDNGVCVGTVVDYADAGPELLGDHCGVDTPVGFTPGKLKFSCGG
jgi:hypothetical protein